MNPVIIACRTLEKELLAVMKDQNCGYPIIWLEAGDHNAPRRRRTEIQSALAQCGEFDTVLLAMAFCGGAAAGLHSNTHTLVLPRCGDCIPLLLGSQARRKENRDLYYLSEGWINGSRSILREYDHCLEKYGEERTRRLFREMLHNYHGICVIKFPFTDVEKMKFRAERFAEETGLPLIPMEGSLEYLSALLRGPWDEERFLTVKPGEMIAQKDLALPGGAAVV